LCHVTRQQVKILQKAAGGRYLFNLPTRNLVRFPKISLEFQGSQITSGAYSGKVHVPKARNDLVSKLLDEAPGSGKGRNRCCGGDESVVIIIHGTENRHKQLPRRRSYVRYLVHLVKCLAGVIQAPIMKALF
jgi:hypothetical protein